MQNPSDVKATQLFSNALRIRRTSQLQHPVRRQTSYAQKLQTGYQCVHESPKDGEKVAKLEYANDGQGDGMDWVVDS
ncbi:hypothetical protein WJX82_002839 [Trebouxia sp. C0006]